MFPLCALRQRESRVGIRTRRPQMCEYLFDDYQNVPLISAAEELAAEKLNVSERVAIGVAVEAELGERRGRDNVANSPQLKNRNTP